MTNMVYQLPNKTTLDDCVNYNNYYLLFSILKRNGTSAIDEDLDQKERDDFD